MDSIFDLLKPDIKSTNSLAEMSITKGVQAGLGQKNPALVA